MRPSDLPDGATIGARLAHGVRAKYIGGCRCPECRACNTAYERARAKARRRGDWNGLVDAAETRAHLVALSAAGVGLREVSNISGVPRSLLALVKSGKKTRLRARGAKAILRVDTSAITEVTLVPSAPTWALLRELLALGMTKTEIARRLGSKSKSPALQFRSAMVLARTVLAVQRLHKEVIAELRVKHEVREEMRALASRPDEVAAVLELRDARRREVARQAARERKRAS